MYDVVQIYDHQHHMGLLILEKKDLASKYEQLKALAESSELMHKHDSAMNKSALTESRKREESLKKTVSVKDACIASVRLWNSSPPVQTIHARFVIYLFCSHFYGVFFVFCSLRRPCMSCVQKVLK